MNEKKDLVKFKDKTLDNQKEINSLLSTQRRANIEILTEYDNLAHFYIECSIFEEKLITKKIPVTYNKKKAKIKPKMLKSTEKAIIKGPVNNINGAA